MFICETKVEVFFLHSLTLNYVQLEHVRWKQGWQTYPEGLKVHKFSFQVISRQIRDLEL